MSEQTSAAGDEQRLGDLRTMARIRAFEERVSRHFREGLIPGFVHVSIGRRRSPPASAAPSATTTSSPPPTAATATAWPRASIPTG